jgi:hypothetical protein
VEYGWGNISELAQIKSYLPTKDYEIFKTKKKESLSLD